MGIFIHLYVSDSVTKEEWNSVYEESLKLIDKFPFAETVEKTIEGIDVYCMVPTKERVIKRSSRTSEKDEFGWIASKDYNNLNGAERYVLYRDLTDNGENTVEEFNDPLLKVAKEQLRLSTKIKDFFAYRLWGNKTQGETYHVYLLGIACMIADRLGDKVFIYGDITRGQCKMALKEVNKILQKPINLPDQCDVERFISRISKLPIKEVDKLKIFENFYLGKKDAEFGKCFRKYFSEKACTDYWKSYFKYFKIDQVGFGKLLREYLLWGFDIEKLCHIVKFNKKDDSDYKYFIDYIFEAKLHIKDKNCEQIFEIDKELEETYGIPTLMSQFFLLSRGNKCVDRYIPIEEIREALSKGIGKYFDVNTYIDKCLKKEKLEQQKKKKDSKKKSKVKDNYYDGRNDLEKSMTELIDDYHKKSDKYDILETEQLIQYKPGDKISPEIDKGIKEFFKDYNELKIQYLKMLDKQDVYKNFLNKGTKIRFEFLVKWSENKIILRDKDWEKIYKDLDKSNDAFEKYSSLLYLDLSNNQIYELVRALIVNDDLYQHYQKG